MKNKTIFLLGMLVIIPFLIAAQEPRPRDIADVIIKSDSIYFMPRVNQDGFELVVSFPNGSFARKIFPAGSQPFFGLAEITGNLPYEGSYNYELRVIPTEKRSRQAGDISNAGLNQNAEPIQEILVQSGNFLVLNGTIVPKGLPEGLLQPNDVVHADDVIITGSQCIGYDCLTDGTENFGFDTIKMKENNIRIFFDDTSSTAGFPANDWRIITNDSSSGGGNYFSIEDSTAARRIFTLEAGAPSNSIYVSSTGRLGINTSTPVLNMHIKYGDTPSIRLEQDTSLGWTAQTWDIAGNESNFFIRDTTGGSKLPFRIQPGAPTNTITLKSDGRVGFGTWSPGYPVELTTTGKNASFVCNRTDGASNFISSTTTYGQFGTVSNHAVRILANSSPKITINTDGTLNMADGGSYTGTWNPASSRTIKENIKNLNADEAFAALKELTPVKYNYKTQKDDPRIGFIAEDVPDLVAMKDRKTLGTVDIMAVLTKVVKEQQKTIDDQQKSIDELKKEINKLKKHQ